MIDYIESGMDFSPLFEGETNTIYIEKSNFYNKINSGGGIKTVEFLHMRQHKQRVQLYFIEAKKSAPNPENPRSHYDCDYCQSCPKQPENVSVHTNTSAEFCEECPKNTLNLFCNKIYVKMQHSLGLYTSKLLDINPDINNDFPPCFNETSLDTCDILFLLVIKGHNEQWCAKLRPVLIQKLSPLLRIWNAQVIVIGDDEALCRGFIQMPISNN